MQIQSSMLLPWLQLLNAFMPATIATSGQATSPIQMGLAYLCTVMPSRDSAYTSPTSHTCSMVGRKSRMHSYSRMRPSSAAADLQNQLDMSASHSVA